MAVDWLMRTVTQGGRQGIQWTPMTVLEDPDYADSIRLLLSKHQDAQQKAERLSKTASTIWSQGLHNEDPSSEEEH